MIKKIIYFGNICSDPNYFDDITAFDIEIPHETIENASIVLYSDLKTSYSSWGIRNILLGIYFCHEKCLRCAGPSETDCTSCFPEATLYDNGSCYCNEGFALKLYQISDFYAQSLCEPCSELCKSCSTPFVNNSCLSCYETYYFLDNQVFFF